MTKKRALGRGLNSLLNNADEVTKNRILNGMNEIEVDKIVANPWQPRSNFDEEKLQELSASIKEIGVIQPLTLRKNDSQYQIIAGERRFRAAKMAGLTKVPAYIRTADDQTMLEMALVENIQREDLDPIEIAISYQRLMEECQLTQEAMSERVGKKRSTVTNYLRLLKLPAEVQKGLQNKIIGMGHARALISVENPQDQIFIFKAIVNDELSVRKVEQLVREINNPKPEIKQEEVIQEPILNDLETNSQEEIIDQDNISSSSNVKHSDNLISDKNKLRDKSELANIYSALQTQMSSVFKTNVSFKRETSGNGKIVIPFNSDEELERIIGIMDRLNK